MQESHFTDAFLNGAGMAGNNGAKGPVEHTKIAVSAESIWRDFGTHFIIFDGDCCVWLGEPTGVIPRRKQWRPAELCGW